MSRGIDLNSIARLQVLMHERRATQGTENRTSPAARVFDAKGYEGVAAAIYSIYFDANALAADKITITLEKCTDTSGSDATTLATLVTDAAGDGTAHFNIGTGAVNIYSLGETSGGTAYRYIQAKAAITDGDSSGTYDIVVVLAAGAAKTQPVTQDSD